jgi:hypothetical protein
MGGAVPENFLLFHRPGRLLFCLRPHCLGWKGKEVGRGEGPFQKVMAEGAIAMD